MHKDKKTRETTTSCREKIFSGRLTWGYWGRSQMAVNWGPFARTKRVTGKGK